MGIRTHACGYVAAPSANLVISQGRIINVGWESEIWEGIQISVFIHNKIIFIMNILGLQMSQEYLPVDRTEEERSDSFIAFQ